MTPVNRPLSQGQWARIREIYRKLLDAPEDQRSALATKLCEGDPQIKLEIDGLLSAHGKVASFLDEPPTVTLSPEFAVAPVALPSGTVLASRFHIIRYLDAGGMGSVYEAWDLELQEVLAVKTIRPEIASQRSTIEGFKEEVRQAHQITHPNICRVYDLFSHDFGYGDRVWFFTMQLLRGETLLQRLHQKGPLSYKESLVVLRQMIFVQIAFRNGRIQGSRSPPYRYATVTFTSRCPPAN